MEDCAGGTLTFRSRLTLLLTDDLTAFNPSRAQALKPDTTLLSPRWRVDVLESLVFLLRLYEVGYIARTYEQMDLVSELVIIVPPRRLRGYY